MTKCSVKLRHVTDKQVVKYTQKLVCSSVSKISNCTAGQSLLVKTRTSVKYKKSIVHQQIYKCSSCTKTFTTQNRLYKHERTHVPGHYICDVYKKRFQYPKILSTIKMYMILSHMLSVKYKGVRECMQLKRL